MEMNIIYSFPPTCERLELLVIGFTFFFIRHTFLLLILFLIPGIVMMVAYGLISLELYQGIKFDASQKKSARGNNFLVYAYAKDPKNLFSVI